MSKRRLSISVLVILALLLLVFGIVWNRNNQNSLNNEPGTENLDFFPLGESRPIDNNPIAGQNLVSSSPETEDKDSGLLSSGRFFRITARPVSGAISIGRGTTSAIVYVERATGHLYRINNSTGSERVSNTTIPKIYRLFGGQTSTSTFVVFQYLKDKEIQTFSGRLDLATNRVGEVFLGQETELSPLSGGSLSPNIQDLVISPQQDKILTLETVGEESLIYTSNLDGSKKELLTRSAYPEWRLSWATSSIISLQTRTSQNVPGTLFLFNLKNKTWQRLISNVPGLTTLVSPNLDQVIYSSHATNNTTFGIYDVRRGIFGRLDVKTWTDKCVWSKTGNKIYCAVPKDLPTGYSYPDAWYRGEVVLVDNIWLIDPKTRKSEIIFNPTETSAQLEIDADRLLLDDEETALYLINRRDNSLWSLNLRETF